jgi:hypothetical protein
MDVLALMASEAHVDCAGFQGGMRSTIGWHDLRLGVHAPPRVLLVQR